MGCQRFQLAAGCGSGQRTTAPGFRLVPKGIGRHEGECRYSAVTPAVLIVLQFEGPPLIFSSAPTEGSADRLADWIASRPELEAVLTAAQKAEQRYMNETA
jgi:hypothetical protein